MQIPIDGHFQPKASGRHIGVSDMPTEVLHIIFSFLSAATDLHHLTLICKSWKEVAEPVIYSDISFPNKGYRLLLDRAPHRWRYLRSLKMAVHSKSDRESYTSLLEEARNQGSTIRRVALESHGILHNQELLGKLSQFSLSCLDLSGLRCGISLGDVLTYCDLATLRDLRLGQLTWSKTMSKVFQQIFYDSLWDPPEMTLAHEPNHPASQHSQEQVLPKSRRGKGNLQKLSLVAPAVGPDVVNLLFLWPARLREVTFSRIRNSIHSEYTALEIEKSLDIHQGSLERIDIPALPENGLPNFSSFCELHHLCIHASSLFRMSPYNAWTRLQAPRLRHLTINLDSERESASFDDFGHTESQWLKALLPMIKPASSPQSSLSEISLNFAHEDASPKKGIWEAELWDATKIDEVAVVAASFGIAFTYSKPVFVDGPPWRMGVMNQKASMVYQFLVGVFDEAPLHIEQIADRLDLPVEDACLELEWLLDWEFVMPNPDRQTFSAILYT